MIEIAVQHMPIVNNKVLCTQKFKRANLMLSVLNTHTHLPGDTSHLLEVINMFITLFVPIVSPCMHVSKLIKMCTLNM